MLIAMQYKKNMALAVIASVLTACASGPSASDTARFELHAANSAATPGWTRSRLISDPATSVYLAPTVLLDNTDVATAEARKEADGSASVLIRLTPAGTVRLTQASRALLHRQMATTIDGEVLSAPVVAEPLTENALLLTGFKSFEQAQRAATGIVKGR